MPRQLRIEYEGAIYHVMSRGDRREEIVSGGEDRALWLKTLEEACAKCEWQVPCVLSDEQSLAPRCRNSVGKLGRGNELVPRHPYGALQRAAPPARTSLRWPL